MKTKRGIWNFVNLPHIPKISRAQRRYWKDYLSKVLKLGIEVEFNLPEHNGHSCPGDTDRICTCQEFSVCEERKLCSLNPRHGGSPHYGAPGCDLPKKLMCKKCEKGKCIDFPDVEECPSSCDRFEFECMEENCLYFVPSCWSCRSLAQDQCRGCSEMSSDTEDPELIRRRIRDKLKPTGRVDTAGKSGIFEITTDGSLRGGGVELISAGRRPTFRTLYDMSKEMLDNAKAEGAFIDERCGIHMHLLTGYYPTGGRYVANELERPMPQIILANLHQLIRRYQAALVWMTSCLSSKRSMTRWEKFRIGIHDLSPMEMSMEEVKRNQHSKCSGYGNGKYGFLSYSGKKREERTKFNANGDVEIFHVEFRVPDACWNPSAIAAWSYLIYAALIRAVDLSVYGVMEYAKSPEEAKTLKEEYKAICNNRPTGWEGDRISDTSKAHRYFERYVDDSENLLEILKPILLREEPVFGILKDLAMKPISLRRIGGESFEDIEANMEKYIPKYHGDDMLAIADEAMDLSLFTDCSSLEEWVDHVVDELVRPTKKDKDNISRKIHEYIQEGTESGELVWNTTIGTLVTRR